MDGPIRVRVRFGVIVRVSVTFRDSVSNRINVRVRVRVSLRVRFSVSVRVRVRVRVSDDTGVDHCPKWWMRSWCADTNSTPMDEVTVCRHELYSYG